MNKQSLTHRTLRGLLWTSFGKFGHMLISTIVLIVLARLLTPAQYGVVGAASILVGFSQIFSKIGVGPAIVQSETINIKYIHVGFTLSILFSFIIGILFYYIGPLAGMFFKMPELANVVRVFSIIFPITGLSVVGEALIQREMQLKKLAIVEIISYGLGYGILGIFLAYFGFGIWALVFAQISQSLIKTMALLLLRLDSIGFSVDLKIVKRLLNYGTGFSLAKISNFFAGQADNIVAGRILGAEALGIYGRAYQFLMMPTTLLGQVIDKALFPALTSVQNQKKRLSRAYLTSSATLIMLTLPLSIFLVVLAPEIIFITLGSQWMGVVLPFQILASVLVFRSGYKISDSIARATGAVYRRAWRQLIYAIAVFSGAWVGCRWGLGGLATGVAFAITLNYFLMQHLSIKLTGISIKALFFIYVRYLTVGAGVAIIAISTSMCCHLIGLNSLLTLSISCFTLLIFIIFLLFFCRKIFGDEGKWLYKIIQDNYPALDMRSDLTK